MVGSKHCLRLGRRFAAKSQPRHIAYKKKLRFAIKANFAIVDGEERAVQKLTATKKSKAGRLTVEFKDDKYVTHENGSGSAETNLLELVFKDGKRLRKHTHAEIMTAIDDAQLRLHGISGGKRKAADAFA